MFTVLPWAYFTSMMFASSWGQIDETLRGQVEEFSTAIIVFKLAILVVSVISLVFSVRHASAKHI